jgi:hypothetical protein
VSVRTKSRHGFVEMLRVRQSFGQAQRAPEIFCGSPSVMRRGSGASSGAGDALDSWFRGSACQPPKLLPCRHRNAQRHPLLRCCCALSPSFINALIASVRYQNPRRAAQTDLHRGLSAAHFATSPAPAEPIVPRLEACSSANHGTSSVEVIVIYSQPLPVHRGPLPLQRPQL